MSKKIALGQGVEVIRSYVKNLPATPGVYRMISKDAEVLYIGKAKALKKRVLSYTHVDKLPMRLKRMIAQTVTMEFINTHTEAEALLLESNLIKKLKPRYNILLRDDKSFPYIHITNDHDFAQIKKHRGARKDKGEYFGPFASAGAVNRTIDILQKVFQLRNCSDSVFSNRTRPCLQYHIKRCTAPCVGQVTKEEYADQVNHAQQFLSGQNRQIQDMFVQKMQEASEKEDFEKAAELRDRIKTLTIIQSKQDINLNNIGDIDVMALFHQNGKTCIQVFFFRGGQNYGNRAYFPRHDHKDSTDYIMAGFLAQFYENKPVPKEIYLNRKPSDHALLEEALATRRNQGIVKILQPQQGKYKRLVDFVLVNAEETLKRHLAEQQGEMKHLEAVSKLFDMEDTPKRIEVYDNSHISGTNMVGGMIVTGAEGFQKSAYRKFNIREAKESDDYGMMREVMTRRFTRALKENIDKESNDWPDLLLIDGGQGQFSAVKETLEEMGIYDDLTIVGISKHEGRYAGREQFFVEGKKPFQLPINDPTLYYLQRLRDEVHRFAIGAHRARRKKDITVSPLDKISGIGAKRKKALLLHFGSAKEVASAGIEDLRQVEGVSQTTAEKIYYFFNEA